MGLWNAEGVPHKGWKCIGVADLGEYAAADEKIEYTQCEMCGKESIRYVHSMKHPDYPDILHVGCVCAENMSEDYETPRMAENELKNRAARWRTFEKGTWKYNPAKQSYSRKYNGIFITIVKSRYGYYGIFLGGKSFWNIGGERILEFEKAKRVAFSVYESYVKWRKNGDVAA